MYVLELLERAVTFHPMFARRHHRPFTRVTTARRIDTMDGNNQAPGQSTTSCKYISFKLYYSDALLRLAP